MTTDSDTDFVSIERIAQSILVLRERRVLLDSDLAAMYGVTTKRFNEQVKRNLARFPARLFFKVANCDLKDSASSSDSWNAKSSRPASQVPAIRVHRTRRHHGGDGSQ